MQQRSVLLLLVTRWACARPTFNILDYGAVPDNHTICTASIQAAIDGAGGAGGGDVLVPSGVFKTGTVFLRSAVRLVFSSQGFLQGSWDPADYSEDWD